MDTIYGPYFEIDHRQRHRNRFKAQGKRSHLATGWGDTNPSFTCKNCGAYVSAEPFISGVGHRNHCPYCLWSRHLDLFQAGDRLCACKGGMRPVGLTLKAGHKKYGSGEGELMLVHQCVECETLSINRIAADDLPDALLETFEASLVPGALLLYRLSESGIRLLGATDEEIVRARLFGYGERSVDRAVLDAL